MHFKDWSVMHFQVFGSWQSSSSLSSVFITGLTCREHPLCMWEGGKDWGSWKSRPFHVHQSQPFPSIEKGAAMENLSGPGPFAGVCPKSQVHCSGGFGKAISLHSLVSSSVKWEHWWYQPVLRIKHHKQKKINQPNKQTNQKTNPAGCTVTIWWTSAFTLTSLHGPTSYKQPLSPPPFYT